jgi:hypothetical protein
VDLLVSISIESLGIEQLNRFAVIGDATETHLSFIDQALIKNKPDWERKILEIMESDKLLLKNMWGLCYEVNKEGKVRLNRNPLSALRAQFPDDDFLEQIPSLGYWQKKLIKGWAILHWFYLPSTPQKLSKYIDSIYAKMYEKITRPDFNLVKPPVKRRGIKLNFLATVKLLRSLAEPTYNKAYEMYQRAIGQKRTARIIVALRRYKNQNGHWPGSLDEIESFVQADILVDPLNGGSFVYKLTDENFILYSKGINNIDDGGERGKWSEDKTDTDDLLIWPSRLNETSKEDPNDR